MTTSDAPRQVEREAPQLLRDDPHWYKDAIIYQLHVKAFNDSTNDGVGDFAGLAEKLKSAGVNYELNYRGAPGVKHADVRSYLVETLKAEREKPFEMSDVGHVFRGMIQ